MVLRQIDLSTTLTLAGEARWYWLLLSCFWFTISKVLAAIRVLSFLHVPPIRIGFWANMKLYWVGLFYNLFLPGGIGGDGYKMYWFYRKHKTPLKTSFLALFLDRVNGVTALFFLTVLGVLWLPLDSMPYDLPSIVSTLIQYKPFLAISVLLLLYPAYMGFMYFFFRSYLPVIFKGSLYSFTLQLSQLLGIYCILLGLGIHDNVLAFLIIFLISSVISSLPITIGGIGVRELVFAYGASTFHIDPDLSVAVSILFYAVSLVVSFVGVYFVIFPERLGERGVGSG